MNLQPIPGFSEPFSSISHLLFAGIFFVMSFYLVFKGRGNNARVIGLIIYSFCLVFLFSMSGVYHLLEKGGTANYVLQILDYAGIYCLIAGTFTPIHLILFRGKNRWLVLVIIWTIAITCLTLTAIFFHYIPEWLNLTFFLSLGWMGLYTLWKIYQLHSKKILKYLVFGAFFYTIGAICDFLKWPALIEGYIGGHEVFHVFVVLGAYFHWKLVYTIAEYPISSRIVIIVKEGPDSKFFAKATSEHARFRADSIQEIKQQVNSWMKEQFHNEMRPKKLIYRYLKEERINI